jgi:hypothetical protein
LSTAITRTIITIVVWLALSGAIVAALLWDRVTEQRVSNERVDLFPEIDADRVWFRSPGELMARSVRQGEIRVYSIPVPRNKAVPRVRSVSVSASRPTAVAVDPDGFRAVWATGGQINVASFLGSFGTYSAELPGTGHLVAAAGDLAIAVNDAGEMKVYNISDLGLQREQIVSVQSADMIETAGSFAAVGNSSTGDVGVYDVGSAQLRMVEYRRFGTRLLAINVSTTGRLTVATDRGTILTGSTVAAPGLVRAISLVPSDGFLVGGDFAGVHLVEAAKAPSELARSAAGAVAVASSGEHIAAATPRGLELHAYHYDVAISRRGRDIVTGWLVLTVTLMGAMLSRVVRHLWRRFQAMLLALLMRGGPTGGQVEREKGYAELMEAPADLSQAVAAAECVLVAGEALSKPCGIPLWRSFVFGLLDWAADLRYIDDKEAEQCRHIHKAGELDRVALAIMDRLAGQPERIAEYARKLYLKPAALSNIHEAMSSVAFAGAVTANLDVLAERALSIRQDDLFLPTEIAGISARVSEKRRFMLKIRGHWEKPGEVTLIPSQAFRECTAREDYRELITFLLTSRTLLFIGMSVDDIRTLIEPAGIDKPTNRKHYAILPRSETPKRIDNSFRRSGVRFFAYTDGDTQSICDFLNKLAAERDRMRAAASGAGRA